MIRPLLDEENLQNLNNMDLKHLRPEFQVIIITKLKYNNLYCNL